MILCRLRNHSTSFLHELLKIYIKEGMKKGTYEEVPFQPLVISPYSELMEAMEEEETSSEEEE